ncbi:MULTISPECIES: roadblock/LC7 domain-containing protein [unclassified Streptosporangium]|uniref:roadblock/LC7 domain-containing protein n=1 Tax=Streptosporangium sp. NPDC005286 TaxID=3154463 RepID=UPI0033B5CC2A
MDPEGFPYADRATPEVAGKGEHVLGIEDCLTEVMAIPGALDAILIDQTSGTVVATGGASRHGDVERSAAGLSETLRATLDGLAVTAPGGTVRIDDMIITTDGGHHLLRPLETLFDGPLVIYVRLDLERSNLALARHRLQALSGRLIST